MLIDRQPSIGDVGWVKQSADPRSATRSQPATYFRALCCVLMALAVGCSKAKAPPPANQPTAAAPAAPDTPVEPVTEPPTPAAQVADSDVAPDEPAQGPVEESVAAEPVAEEEPEPATVERFVLFVPGGPLVVELHLSIDGEPAGDKMEQLAAQVLAAADTDGDGTATWEEATHSPRLMYGQFGNMATSTARSRRDVIQRCDLDRDGELDADEVPRLVSTSGGKGFTLTNGRTVAEGRCWNWLNTVEDGVLSTEEIGLARYRLESRDRDDNEMIFLAELSDELPTAFMQPNRRRIGGESAMALGPGTELVNLLVALETRYGSGGPVDPANFPLVPNLFAALDGDGDGSLSEDEMAALGDVPAHLTFKVRFGKREEGETPPARLELTSVSEEISDTTAVLVQRDNVISLQVPGARLAFSLTESGAADDYGAALKRQFEAYDGDANGYLDETEFGAARAAFQVPFAAVDTDEDEKVTLEEATQIQTQRRAAEMNRIRAAVNQHEDELFSALDANDDGRIGARELAGVEQRLRSLDADRDGRLSGDELPVSIVIRFSRGDAQPRSAFVAMPADETVLQKAPAWFRSMDVNGDGDISRREFLGADEQFMQLDEDGDGFVEVAEVSQE